MNNFLVQLDASEFLSRIEENQAQLIYLDAPYFTAYHNHFKYSNDKDIEKKKNEYLAFMRSLFINSYHVLTEDGFLALSVSHHFRGELQLYLEEIFGKRNYVVEIIIPKKNISFAQSLNNSHNAILIFKKSDFSRIKDLYLPITEVETRRYKNEDKDKNGPYIKVPLIINSNLRNLTFEFQGIIPKTNQSWVFSLNKLNELQNLNQIIKHGNSLYFKRYLHEYRGKKLTNVWDDIQLHVVKNDQHKYKTRDSIELLNRIIEITTNENDLVLDPFCGSGTSADASLSLNRKWIGSDIDNEAIKLTIERTRQYNSVSLIENKEFQKKQQYNRKISKKINQQKSIQDKSYDRTIAIIVSLEHYVSRPNNSIDTVLYANNDAELFRKMMISKMNVKDDDIKMLINESALKSDIEYEMKQIFHELKENDRFIFYYVGHGFHDGISNYLTTYDSHPQELVNTTVSLQDILINPILKSKCKSALFFIDACAKKMQNKNTRSTINNIDENEFNILRNDNPYYATFLSCGPGESSYSCNILSNGIWTYHLNEAINGDISSILKENKYITDIDLSSYLSSSVSKYARDLKNYVQHPRAVIDSNEEQIIVTL
jgi:DNA modification methylase